MPKPIPWHSLSFEETLMFHALENSLSTYIRSIDLATLSKKDIFQIFNFLSYLDVDVRQGIESAFNEEYALYLEAISARALNRHELQELLEFKAHQLTLFAILKKDRKKPGILVIRAADGKFFLNEQLGIWSIPVLGMSGRGLPFHHSNGNTPTGIFTIDSVMPLANKTFEFGQFRRLILNFIPKSTDESAIRKYLPANHEDKAWWKVSVVGRELGRHLLRIHGTGRVNINPFTTYFPFVPTSGCLATNEASILGFKKSQDQRLLLDSLMSALNLPQTPENESKIHGLLYVVEFDDSLSAIHFFT